MDNTLQRIRREIMNLVKEYTVLQNDKSALHESSNKIPYAGRVYDYNEVCNLVDASLEFWLTSGSYAKQFEEKLAAFLNVKYALAVNSGSSANLLAFMALTSPLLGKRRIERGDEVITVAAGFPTTVTPIIQYGAVPVFIDVTIPQYNVDVTMLEEALSQKTKAVMLAHTLGNPFDVNELLDFCKKHNLWLIEDNCDALGSQIKVGNQFVYTGTIGDIGTSSFYPPHHITMGEGGAVYTNNALLHQILLSMRDWGRDCICPSGVDNKCGRRFERQYGTLPMGYDHKYVYSHFGYNLKVTDMQAAVGCSQLEKLPGFIKKRKSNWTFLRDALSGLSDCLILPEPLPSSVPSWFGFLITVHESAKISRNELVKELEGKGIQTRMLFSGNLIRHPCFDGMRNTNKGFRVVGNLVNTDLIMNQTFWVGVYPGMTNEKLKYMAKTIIEAVR